MNSLLDYAILVRNVLSDSDCDKIIEWYNDNLDQEFRSMVFGDVNGESPDYRSSYSMCIPLGSEIDNIMAQGVNAALWGYITTVNENIPLKDNWAWSHFLPHRLKTEPFTMNKYEEGGEYKWHTDQGYDLNDLTTFSRCFSVVMYCNDDFEGGETAFQFAEIKPEKGACMVFPSNFMYSHCSLPVKKGVKYSCASWASPAQDV